MATIARGNSDTDLSGLKQALDAYERDHPGSIIELYRQNPASIRVRVINDGFAGMPRPARNREVRKYLAGLDEDIRQQITLLLTLPRAEMAASLMNMEFEDPIPSGL